MRWNGFIIIGLVGVITSLAGSPGYLPRVGPLALRFEHPAPALEPETTLPPQEPSGPTPVATAVLPEANLIPEPQPVEPQNPPSSLMNNPPVVVVVPAGPGATNLTTEPLIGTPGITNELITPQMLLRFFGPSTRPGGITYESVVVPPTEFTPARPPTTVSPSSTVTYTQPKP